MAHHLIAIACCALVAAVVIFVAWIAWTVDYVGGGHNHG
jgi:F0F1-type ATP synthase assembly protein I